MADNKNETKDGPLLCLAHGVDPFSKLDWIDKKQPGGRWAPAFPECSLQKQEKYIERMILKDKKLNLG